MIENRASHPYQRYTITTFQDEGLWWAKARVAEKVDAADRPILGGPWRSKAEATTAAQAFCDSRKAG